jgi:hypothetical protein
MKTPRTPTEGTPFVVVAGRPHLVVNFDLEPTNLPSLPEILEHLLAYHPAEHILVLRPLTTRETHILRQAVVERDRETWAQIVAVEDARYRGK